MSDTHEDAGFGDFSESNSTQAVVEWEDDEDVGWRKGPNPLPILLAAGGAMVVGLSLGIGAAVLVNSGLFSAAPEAPERDLVQADLDPVTVNLRGEDGERVLTVRAQVSIQTFDGARVEMLEPALRDSVLLLASDHSAEEILGASSRRRFRRELTERLDLLLGDDQVSDLYLTELVVK